MSWYHGFCDMWQTYCVGEIKLRCDLYLADLLVVRKLMFNVQFCISYPVMILIFPLYV